eukprot:jgi/Psemu1/61742/gm1.61742_g
MTWIQTVFLGFLGLSSCKDAQKKSSQSFCMDNTSTREIKRNLERTTSNKKTINHHTRFSSIQGQEEQQTTRNDKGNIYK